MSNIGRRFAASRAWCHVDINRARRPTQVNWAQGPEECPAEIETNNKLAFWMVLSDQQLVDLLNGDDSMLVKTFPDRGLMPFLDNLHGAHDDAAQGTDEFPVSLFRTARSAVQRQKAQLKALAFKLANNSVDLLLRANRTTQVQVHQGTRWRLTKQELGTQQTAAERGGL